ncbi:MAG: GDP-mannose 4,6-dehydratase [Candidatus Thorarchaeota archaeon]|jgi:UDP-glucose 4-epimerase
MKVLITGVAGMIGSHLADSLLEEGHEVIGVDNLSYGHMRNIEHNLDNPKFKFFKYDVMVYKEMETCSENVDIIFHMAAVKKVGEHDGLSVSTLNVSGIGASNIFKVALENNCKVVLASTSDVYGVGKVPFKEIDPPVIGPSYIRRWSYATAKLYSEQLAYAYYKDFNVPMVILRYCGAFSHRSGLEFGGHIPLFIDAVLNDKEIIIHGDGSQTRPFSHINDAIKCTLLAAKNKKAIGQIFNVGGKGEISILDIALLIHEIADTGNPIKLKYIPMKSVFGEYKEIMRREIDMSKTEKILGFKQTISIREGLKMIIDKWRKKL